MGQMADYSKPSPDVAAEISAVQRGARTMIDRKLAQGLPVHEGGTGPDEGRVLEVRMLLEVSGSQRPLTR